MKQFTQSL